MKKNKDMKKIAIWGCGRTGISALTFFKKQGYYIYIIDQNVPSKKLQKLLTRCNVTFIEQKNIRKVFCSVFCILPSPGINIEKHYATYKDKFISELDLFYNHFDKPSIAITGSVGKTSITTICAEIISRTKKNCFVGGNIGIPMLKAINEKNTFDCALLELSSFQLEYTRIFAPDIAVLTNIYPNHFDRHKNIQNYINAKLHIFAYQHKNQYAILPLSLQKIVTQKISLKQQCIFFILRPPTNKEKKELKSKDAIIFMHKNNIIYYQNNHYQHVTKIPINPTNFFAQNWLIVCAIIKIMHIPMHYLHQANFTLPEHRLEYITTHNNVHFYNDSKSTTPSSTQAALSKFKNKQIHLFLGGLDKGLDREPLIASCKNKKIIVYTFGMQADALYTLCRKYSIPAKAHDTLVTAFECCIEDCKPEDIVLFSPSGSSFDLYKNYQERGRHFKQLVTEFCNK